MTEQEMIEALADAEHASWARWMAYLFSRARSGPGFTKHISYDDVTRWQQRRERKNNGNESPGV